MIIVYGFSLPLGGTSACHRQSRWKDPLEASRCKEVNNQFLFSSRWEWADIKSGGSKGESKRVLGEGCSGGLASNKCQISQFGRHQHLGKLGG